MWCFDDVSCGILYGSVVDDYFFSVYQIFNSFCITFWGIIKIIYPNDFLNCFIDILAVDFTL